VTDFSGAEQSSASTVVSDSFVYDNGGAVGAYGRIAPSGSPTLSDELLPGVNQFAHNLVAGPGKTNYVRNTVFVGDWSDAFSGFAEWFDNFHVVPRSFDFGNILSTQTSPLEVFSGYRTEERTWSSFVNNAGAGTELVGIPSLPVTMFPLEGYAMTLEVSTSGNPSVDDDLAFVFDFGGDTINVPIVLNRIVLFPVRPEIPYTERLQFRTDVLTKQSGKEQRIKLRKNPRQFFDWSVRMDDGTFDKSRMDTLLFDWQSRTWGIPMWHEATTLTTSAAAGTLTINVGTTANADYRVDGLVMIYSASDVFDVQTVSSLTATTITLKNATLNSFAFGSAVAPLRTANMKRQVSASRFISGDQTLDVSFRVLDNDNDLADATGWSTYNSKVMLDTCNVVRGSSLSETYEQAIIVMDGGVGLTSQDSPWANGKRSTTLTLRASTAAEVWDIRQLLHYFAGRQVSFYVPTFTKDLLADQPLATASQDLIITNIGYTQFVRQRQPRNHIWVRLTDGTVLTRQITNSLATSSLIETLELDSTWGQDVALDEIERISYLEEVRFNADDIVIEYARGERQVYVTAPIISTFD
tara:strand:- start:27696 stop:29441 length:1746 start_codon:yes stop_codon:yes gene_type:complete